jgi:predicted nucleic acid-binding protein
VYTLDTNALIYHLHDEPSVRDFIDEGIQNATPLYVSAITITELFRFPRLSLQEEAAIIEIISVLSIIIVDLQIARKAGNLGRTYNLKVPDSIIAATALFTGSTLLTRNTRDFRRVPSLSLQNI